MPRGGTEIEIGAGRNRVSNGLGYLAHGAFGT
jgi:hypothetical protein